MNKEQFEQFREYFNRFEKSFEVVFNKNWDRSDKYAKFESQYKDIKVDKVKLNVGGFEYCTSVKTLKNSNESFFRELLASNNINEEIHIDRPGNHFNYILKYLRGEHLNLYLMDEHLKLKLAEEAKFYGLLSLAEDLEFTENTKTVNTHIHSLTKVKAPENFVCRGTSLFTDVSDCQNVTKETRKYIYTCLTCIGKGKNGDINYCVSCSKKTDTSFKTSIHPHELTLHKSGGWGCDGRHGKDGCLSNNQTSGILRFRCSPCDYDHCEYCLTNYH